MKRSWTYATRDLTNAMSKRVIQVIADRGINAKIGVREDKHGKLWLITCSGLWYDDMKRVDGRWLIR